MASSIATSGRVKWPPNSASIWSTWKCRASILPRPHPEMLTLAADTSLPVLTVALFDETLIGSVALEGKQSRNEKLLPAIDWLLTESGRGRSDLRLLAVTRG